MYHSRCVQKFYTPNWIFNLIMSKKNQLEKNESTKNLWCVSFHFYNVHSIIAKIRMKSRVDGRSNGKIQNFDHFLRIFDMKKKEFFFSFLIEMVEVSFHSFSTDCAHSCFLSLTLNLRSFSLHATLLRPTFQWSK